MRVLLTSNASYAPPRGGSTRSNLLWLAHLARSGHQCEVVSPTIDSNTPDSETVNEDGVRILSYRELTRRTAVLTERIRNFAPDWMLVSSEDVAHVLLRVAQQEVGDRIVYVAHTPQFYPFGPASWNPDPQAALIVKNAAGIVAIGQHMAGYIKEHLGATAAVIHPPMYGEPPYNIYTSPDSGFILMINPSVVKGISIFTALADRLPEHPFAALVGWGTTARDRAELARRSNVTVLESVRDIEEVLSKARLLLMPSIWYEGFGLIAMESMLRGLPVIASDSGGLMEAKKGTGYIIPVKPVERFEPVFDEAHMPTPVETPQDIEPWEHALRELLEDRNAYLQEAERSRQAAIAFVSKLDVAEFERFLLGLKPRTTGTPIERERPADPRLQNLSPAKRALLLEKLKKR